MPRKKKRYIKVLKTFCTFHPDFKIKDNGEIEILSTGYYGVEWTVKEDGNSNCEHYVAKFKKKERADELLAKLGPFYGALLPYKGVEKTSPIFTAGKLVNYIRYNRPYKPSEPVYKS